MALTPKQVSNRTYYKRNAETIKAQKKKYRAANRDRILKQASLKYANRSTEEREPADR